MQTKTQNAVKVFKNFSYFNDALHIIIGVLMQLSIIAFYLVLISMIRMFYKEIENK